MMQDFDWVTFWFLYSLVAGIIEGNSVFDQSRGTSAGW